MFWKRASKDEYPLPGLGHLETAVLEALWSSGESSVRDLSAQLDRPLAYTTVMTTLDRLFKKGLLLRRKVDRAFLYAPRLTRSEWEQRRTAELVASLFAFSGATPRDALVSNLVDAFGQHDRALLDELERKISQKRKELDRRIKP
jgi:predicted transcriptional regulator